MTSPYSAEFDPEHEHEWQRNGVVGRQDNYLLIEYVCVNGECDAKFSDTEPIDEEKVAMVESWPFNEEDVEGGFIN